MFFGPKYQYFEIKKISQTRFANTILTGPFEESVLCFLNEKKKKFQQNKNSEGLSSLVLRCCLKCFHALGVNGSDTVDIKAGSLSQRKRV